MEKSYDVSCPKCNQKMVKGYIYSPHRICWTNNEKTQFFAGDETLVGLSGFKMKKVLAYRCGNCKIVTFEYDL